MSARAVGAHQLHLQGGAIGPAVACAECHTVPTTAAHANGKVDLAFGTLATTGGAVPTWNGSSCSASYCHGGFAGGSSTNAPVWTQARATSCGTCHGLPPAAPHPDVGAASNCGTCHTGYTATTVNLATHVDGKVDVANMSCTSCHGDPARADTTLNPRNSAAPPTGSKGESATTTRAVGAHALHLKDGNATACTECHTVPTSNTHSNGSAEIAFGTVAGTGGATPAWTGATCSNVYCHGAFPGGNAGYTPTWTSPAASSCGTCHGVPPSAPHTQSSDCASCHTGYTSTSVNASTHVNGRVDVAAMSCTSCHGDATRVATALNPDLAAAPPRDTTGSSATTSAGVGAHQAHLNAGSLRSAMACTECHATPGQGTHPSGALDLAWGPLASAGGAVPAFDPTGLTCTNYCHGATLGGATHTRPLWTGGSVEVTCGSCHGSPPPAPHPFVAATASCGSCHPGSTRTAVDPATHVNGLVEVNLSCTSCHGDAARAGTTLNPLLAAAPPVDAKGNTATTARGVGAHLRHLQASATSSGTACGECHTVVPSNTHSNGVAEVVFGTLAKTGNVSPAWNGSGCASSYCHGNFRNGATTYVPSWTAPAANACGTCHGLPPGGTHPANAACGSCHTGYTATTVNLTSHINGSIDVANMTCTSCHGTTGRASVAGADLNQAAAPPIDTAGASTGVAVGTHLGHVNPAAAGAVYKPVACSECHPNNAGNISHSNSTVNVTFATATGANLGAFTATLVQGNGTTTQTTCATYCHGSSLNATTTRGSVASWSWNSAVAADCGSCHKSPPTTANHHNAAALTTCSACHGGTVNAAGVVNVAGGLHVNGAIDTSTFTCVSCHGGTLAATGTQDPNVGAAPRGVGSPDTYGLTAPATANGVGVHAAHVLGTRSRPVLCNACHVVPTTQVHKTGAATAGTVTLANLSNTGGVTSTYAGAGGTCSNTYCHGNFAGGAGAIATPTWKTAATLACTSCHGAPPALTATSHHPANATCATCHGAGNTATTVVAATHVDGTVNLSRSGCTLCHGDLTQTAVAATSNASAPGFNAAAADTTGATAATAAAVGAHAAHLVGTRWRSTPLACNECHTVPGTGDVAHATGAGTGGARATIAFGALARTGGITTAAYAGSTTGAGANGAGTCSNIYCHGNFRNGATTLAPSWLGGVAAANCGTCHGTPPGGTHTTSTACASCHTGYTATTVNAATHLNGVIDVDNLTCTSCHGTAARASVAGADLNQAAAPPLDTAGASTGVAVGTHLGHVNPVAAGAVYKAVACTECHPNNTSNAHSNNVVNVTFATATGANLGAFTATLVQGNGTTTQTTCATYCHGSSLNATTTRGSVASWSWNSAVAADCGSCHKSPPTTANHHNAAALTTCSACHGGTVNAAGVVNVAGGLHVNGAVDTSTLTCVSCHGGTLAATGTQDPNVGAAPRGVGSPDTYGLTAPATANGVGVHAAHVLGTRSRPVLCNACHVVPTTQVHKTGAATAGTVTLANLSNTGGVTSTYAGAGGTCSNTYCHGNFAGGAGAIATPTWKTAATLACTSCHGAPPALTATSHHPANATCATCHGAGNTATTVVAATHVDGTVNLSRSGCTLCHGDLTQTAVAATSNASAPGFNAAAADTTGATAATAAAVGAHAAHLVGTRWRSTPLACSECHTVPGAGDVAHATGAGTGGARATIAFGTLARTGGITTAAYAGSTTGAGANGAGTCSNIYCHGNFRNGATTLAPSWLGGVAAANCGTCHGTPPGGTHTTSTACASCHTGYTATTVNAATHLNGVIDVDNLTCTSCHGTAARASVAGADLNQAAAPPLDTAGASAGVAVGTHLGHVNPVAAGAVYKPVACSECHPNNTSNAHSNNVVNVTFATATGANLGAFTATLVQGNGTTTQTTCATYCHGSSLNATTTRGSVATWSWNSAVAADCGSCHKSPPTTANHHNAAALTTCSACHGGTVNAAGVVNVAGGLHVNGAIDTSTLTCVTCHGAALAATGTQDPNIGAAPRGTGAPDTYGTVLTTARGVGVHAAHVLGTRSRPVLCNACHVVPAAQVHKTGPGTTGTVGLANLSVTGGITTASYSTTALTCSNTYCHGNLGGGVGAATVTPAWTTAATLACNVCHGMPPSATSTGRTHPNRTDCGSCHAGYTGVAVNATTHVNGVIEYTTQTCTSCHGDPARTGSDANLVAFSSSPPVDSSGASTGAKVGAHAGHLFTGAAGGPAFSKQVACSECHSGVIPATPLHANGQPNVAFGTLARTGGITTAAYTPGATGTCSNTYCHGNFTNGVGASPITWTAAAMTCTSCHGTPPGGTHPAGSTITTCGNCHGNYSNAAAAINPASGIIDPAGHVNGAIDLSNMSCTSCHGAAGRASVAGADLNQASSPPVDTAGLTTSARVGTHLGHVNPVAAGAVYKAVACTECHPNNAGNNAHDNGVVNVTFATATGANLGAFTATLVLGNGTTQTTCATYCHGSSLNATTTRGSVASWSWNSAVPADCGSCHKSPPTTANHHNAAALTTCSACHGGTVNAAGVVNVAGGLHVNGAIDTSTLTCTTCHGAALAATGTQDPNIGAAPRGTGAPDTYGTVLTTARGVGVHAAHVLGTRSRPVLCNACHVVPAAQVHKTGAGTTGTVGLANLSVTGGITTASYSTTALTCSNTYCHGNLGGGVGAASVTPAWTAAATLACTSCHGMPPSATSTGRTHPNRTDCGSCHAGYTGVAVNATTHVNGVIEYTTQTCTSCHGDPARTGSDANLVAFNSSPPVDSSGASTGAKVGAHAKHLFTGAAGGPSYSKQVACSECHNAAIPATPLHANGQPNVAFGTLARTGAVVPAYTPGAVGSCSSTYCHGNFTNGVGANPITWTATGLTCTSCHGTPPGGTHPAGSTLATCGNCHGNYNNATQSIISAAGHVDGAVDLSNMSCTSCHGTSGRTSGGIAGVIYDANQASSPPLDTANLSTSARVGTHIAHVNPTVAGGVYKPVACIECHPNNTSNAHANSVRDVVFPVGGAARLAGYAAGFTLGNGTTQTTCATYCHGASLNGTTTLGSVGAWSWNSAVAADCGSCHKSPPTTANHHNAAALTTCSACHGGTVNAAGVVNVAGGLHVNGAIDTSTLTCTTCHGAALAATGTQDPNIGAAPRGTGAPDTYGTVLTTARGVGVHAAHVLGTRSRPVLCNACHVVPAAQVHKTGPGTTGTVGLANLSVTGGITTASYSTTALTCSNTYCHGNLGGGVGAATVTPAWTAAATLACTSCHGAPPTTMSSGGTHPARTDCGTCHAGYGGTSAATWTVNAATHVDGAVQIVAQTCTSCHGTTGRASVAGADLNQAAAPPLDSHGSATSVLVGMHLAHVNPAASTATTPAGTQPIGGVYRPIACTECHPNNTAMTHSNGAVNLDFTLATGARLNGFAAVFTQGNGTTTATTCSTYCHGAGLGTIYQGTTIIPAWNGAVAACTSCHGFPPSSAAHNGPPVVASDSRVCASCHAGTVNPDGTINVAGGKHINGSSDAVKGDTCSGCHDFGMVAATTYHHVMATDPTAAYPVANGPAIPDASRNCNICHMKHEFTNPATNLRNTINSATPTGATTDTALCVSCHQQNVQTKDLTRQKTDGTAQTALIDSAAFTGSAHDYLVDGAFGVNVMQMNCVKCHNSDSTPAIQTGTYKFALHSSADRRLRAPLGRTTLTDDDSANFCYRCHSATTDATLTGTKKTVTANDWYGKVTTMPAGSTGIYAQMQKGTSGGAGTTQAATTLYLRNTNTVNAVEGSLPAAYILASGTYAGTTTFSQYDMALAAGATTATRTNTSGTTTARYLRFGQFVSPAVAAAVTIPSGSIFQIKTRAQVSAAGDTENERFQVWRRTAAGVNTPLNTAVQQSATALTTTATNRTFNFTTNTAVTLAAGDSLVMEVETLKGSATSSTVTENYGNFATDAASVVLPVSITFQATAAATASGRHDVGAYVGKHKPNPAEEHLQYIAANEHVDCADCHDPHRSKRGNQGDMGTVTAAGTGCTNTTTTLCNTAATWPVDAWKGYFLDIHASTVAGTSIGNRVQITSNTATQLTLASTTGTAPATGNAYRISMRANGGAVTAATTTTLTDTQSAVGGAKAWSANLFAGWYVHIVFGPGIGQSAQIASNTATQLTINGTWTTTPTTASRYVISKMPNVMLGTSGVNVAAWGAATGTAWGETKTFNPAAGSTTTLPDATTQWQVCFKCHSAANTALATWNATYTDLAQDFNPRNQSYHPVLAPSATNATSGLGNTILNAADLTNGWKPGDMMTCTDCHGNDDQATGASHGPHASAVKYILKGPNTRWPTRADGVTRWMAGTTAGTNMLTDNAGTADGLFCLNCHSSTLRSTPHTNQSQHRVACTGCHLRVPHGGKVKRLIRTTNTPAPYADTGTAAQLTGYNGGTQTSSCGAGCTGTHNGLVPNTTTAPVTAW